MAYRLKTFQVQFVGEPQKFPEGSSCGSSEQAANVARAINQTLDADKEHFLLLVLNNKHRVNGFKIVSTGTLTASLVHPREVWRAALNLCGAAVILSITIRAGIPAPSQEDIEITRRLTATGEMLGIRVLDHLVLGEQGRFFSFNDSGLLHSTVSAIERVCAPKVQEFERSAPDDTCRFQKANGWKSAPQNESGLRPIRHHR